MDATARAGQSPVRWQLSVEVFQHQAQAEASVLPMHFLGTLGDLPSCNLTSKTCWFVSFFQLAYVCYTWCQIEGYFQEHSILFLHSPTLSHLPINSLYTLDSFNSLLYNVHMCMSRHVCICTCSYDGVRHVCMHVERCHRTTVGAIAQEGTFLRNFFFWFFVCLLVCF